MTLIDLSGNRHEESAHAAQYYYRIQANKTKASHLSKKVCSIYTKIQDKSDTQAKMVKTSTNIPTERIS